MGKQTTLGFLVLAVGTWAVWPAFGVELLTRKELRQFYPDGSHVSLSTGYNFASIRALENAVRLYRRFGREPRAVQGKHSRQVLCIRGPRPPATTYLVVFDALEFPDDKQDVAVVCVGKDGQVQAELTAGLGGTP
jgi:hypothetical protein